MLETINDHGDFSVSDSTSECLNQSLVNRLAVLSGGLKNHSLFCAQLHKTARGHAHCFHAYV